MKNSSQNKPKKKGGCLRIALLIIIACVVLFFGSAVISGLMGTESTESEPISTENKPSASEEAAMTKEEAIEYVAHYSIAEDDFSKANAVFEEYCDEMTQDEIAYCLFTMSYGGALIQCDSYIKSELKNPSSYSRTDDALKRVYATDDGEGNHLRSYAADIEILYSATNSANARVSDNIDCKVDFILYVDDMRVQIMGAESTGVSAYLMAK